MNDLMKDTLELVKAFEKIEKLLPDGCRVTFEKASGYTYHVKIVNAYGGLHRWDIIGCGNTLQVALVDAIFVFDNCNDKVKMYGKEWQFKPIDALKQ